MSAGRGGGAGVVGARGWWLWWWGSVCACMCWVWRGAMLGCVLVVVALACRVARQHVPVMLMWCANSSDDRRIAVMFMLW